jgi:hypothetical protein
MASFSFPIRGDSREWGASLGNYAPPEPFPEKDSEQFKREINLMRMATRAFLQENFEYRLTLIEEIHMTRIATDLADFYASYGCDTSRCDRISHITTEIFVRFLLERGWSLNMVQELKKMSPEMQWQYLQQSQARDHHHSC